MYRINLRSNMPKYILGAGFLLAAIMMIFILSFIAQPVFEAKNNTDSYVLSSRVELNKDSSSQYSPVYYYTVGGNEFACHTGFSTSVKPSDEQVKIFYNSNEPSKCISEYEYKFTSKLAFIFIPIPVIISLLLGLFLIFSAFKKSANVKKLTQCGQLIKNIPCKIVHSLFTLNGVNGYNIEIKYEVSEGNILYLKSDMKFNNDFKGRETADLLIDPMNQKNYFIDFDIT